MAEKRTPVVPVMIDYMCDECGEKMGATGEMHPVKPPIYIYACPNGHLYKSRGRYPRVDYEPVV